MKAWDALMGALGWYPVRAASRRQPSEAELLGLEASLGGRLPSDYRQFVNRYGQGAFRQAMVFPISGDCPWGDWGYLDLLYGFSNELRGSLPDALDLFAERIPSGMLPIAEDPGGNLVLLNVANVAAEPGSIWFWDHEGRSEGSASTDTPAPDVYPVAGSFLELLELLRPHVRQSSEGWDAGWTPRGT